MEKRDQIFTEAIVYGVRHHQGQRRKMNDIPYFVHPMEVATIVSTITTDEDVIAAAILHDTVEDTDATIEEIRELFGDRVADYVGSETEDKCPGLSPEESWRYRKEKSLEELANTNDINVKILWLSDKLSNMRSFYRTYLDIGEELWNHLNMKDPKMHEWYYRSIGKLLEDLIDTAAYWEYMQLVNRLFQ